MPLTFKEKVQKVVKSIPKGETMTYKQVAAAAGNEDASRAVGNIMSHNKDISIPCHRVVRSDGKLGPYNQLRGESKKALLEKEGAI